MMNPELNINDVVVLINMDGELDMTFGLKGQVISISNVFGNKQYKVKWEDGRVVDLLEDADKWMSEDEFESRIKKKKIKESYVVTKKQLMSHLRLQ